MTGYNLFQYCGNNPVNRIDPTGKSFILACIIGGTIIGALAGGHIAGSTAKNSSNPNVSSNWGWYAVAGIVGGGIVGGLAGWGVGAAATAIGATAISSVGTAATAVGNKISQGAQKVGNAISSIGKTNVYRSVSQAEANSIKSLDKFTISPAGMEAKQFGFSMSETMKFGQSYGQSIIAKASVPNNMLSQFYTGGVDPTIFRSGTLTVYGDQLEAFNQAVAGSIRIMS